MTEVQQNFNPYNPNNDLPPYTHDTALVYDVSKTPDDSPKGSPVIKGRPNTPQGHRELPPNWERVKSEHHGRYYYWNRETNKTVWKFPEEEAKEHQKIVRSHNYENVKVSPKTKSKRSRTPSGSPTKSPNKFQLGEPPMNDQKIEQSARNTQTNDVVDASYGTNCSGNDSSQENVSIPETTVKTQTATPKSRTPSQGSYVNIEIINSVSPSLPADPTSPASIANSESGEKDSRKKRPSLPPLRPCQYEEIDSFPQDRSNERRVSESESTRSPTPPLPSRNYSEEDLSFSPPPDLPSRGYDFSPPAPVRRHSSSDLLKKRLSKTDTNASKDQNNKFKSSTFGTHSSRAHPRSIPVLLKSPNEEQKAVLEREVADTGDEYTLVDRSHKSSHKQTSPAQNGQMPPPPVPLRAHQRLAQDAEDAGYSSIVDRSRAGRYIELDVQTNNDPKLSGHPTKPVAYAVVELNGERDRPPLPDPALSKPLTTSLRKVLTPPRPRPYEIPSPANSLENLLDPGYEEIRDDMSKPNGAGYMEVKKESQLHYQRTASQVQEKMRRLSSKELYELPSQGPTAKDATGDEMISLKRESPMPGRDSPLSQDSVFDSEQRYDVPVNSKRLQKLNVTLPRGTSANTTGYSRLGDLSREAILLRSGVTLRRYGQGESVSSLLSAVSKRESVEDQSEESSGGSDQDDGLEPVHRAIKSLETSLGVSADNLSGSPDQYVKMARAPVGPPSWTKVKRRPHAYEEMNNSQEDEHIEPANQTPGKTLVTASSVDMDWDETDLVVTKTEPSKLKDLSRVRSASQPNLLRDVNGAFPHLKKPNRVSDEAYQLRKLRLMNHKYEDVTEWPDMGMNAESVGDVNALTAAIKESWLESDHTSGDVKLPKGWQKLKDEKERVYYWHVPTGRTQYTKPTGEDIRRLSLSVEDRHSVRSSSTPPDGGNKRRLPTFKTRFLGSQDIDESELVQGECVKVVHACIDKMTAEPEEHEPDKKVQSVYLQVHNADLRWLDPETSTSTTTQPINKIRVWGIGLENERDFGYVARDTNTKKHKCHVFRCERPARAVARALLEAHQKERQERKARKAKKQEEVLTSSGSSSVDQRERSGLDHSASPDPVKESQAGTETAKRDHSITPPHDQSGNQSAHRYERITCAYIGSCDVSHAKGMEVVNEAVEMMRSKNKGRWLNVNLDVATSHIKISDMKSDTVLREHRVRFLCFLGIAKDDRYCGYILDNGIKHGVKQFQFHGFFKEPNTDRLCLALHNACQARYQRVLESNPEAAKDSERASSVSSVKEQSPPEKASSKSTPNLFGRLGSLRKTKKLIVEDESKLQSFIVQYLGSQAVSKPEGLETVRVPVQQMAIPKVQNYSMPPHLVEFDVSPGGLYITDPQKKLFSRKHFVVKNITYVVRIRNYFAFISRDGGKLNCHVFLENEVDAGTIVNTIERMLAPDSSKSPTK